MELAEFIFIESGVFVSCFHVWSGDSLRGGFEVCWNVNSIYSTFLLLSLTWDVLNVWMLKFPFNTQRLVYIYVWFSLHVYMQLWWFSGWLTAVCRGSNDIDVYIDAKLHILDCRRTRLLGKWTHGNDILCLPHTLHIAFVSNSISLRSLSRMYTYSISV